MMSRFDAGDDPEFNPYASPKTDSKAPIRHYRVVLWRLTYVECWRMAPNPLTFVILAMFKTLRVPVETVSAVTYPARLTSLTSTRSRLTCSIGGGQRSMHARNWA